MLTKVLLAAAAAAALSTAAYAQQDSATSPNTVNPVLPAEPAEVVSPPAPTGTPTDVVAISPDEARARGITVEVVASAPVPDTPANRAAYGAPMSNAGKKTAPRGN